MHAITRARHLARGQDRILRHHVSIDLVTPATRPPARSIGVLMTRCNAGPWPHLVTCHVSRVSRVTCVTCHCRQIIVSVCSDVVDCVMVLWSAEDTGEDAAVAATYTIDSNAMSDETQGPRMITH